MDIPEIYQIEIASRCNFSCKFCETGDFGGKVTKDSFIDMGLLETIIERDLGGSYYIELQHRGEPLLNKKFGEIVKMFPPNISLGLSTNGSLIHKHIEDLLKLDYITISVDSMNESDYLRKRVGGNFNVLFENIELLVKERGDSLSPVIDLQIIEFIHWKKNLKDLQQYVEDKKWKGVFVRTVSDSFQARNDPENFLTRSHDLCLNPWTSVSIHSNGDVVPCCMAWTDEICYGNLNELSLEEIWKTSEVLKEFRFMHRINSSELPRFCKDCTKRSPVLFHFDLYKNYSNFLIKDKK